MTTEQNIQERINQIETELKDDPNNATLLNDLGVGHFLLGEYEKSVTLLKRAADKSQSSQHYFNLGNAYSECNKKTLAIDAYLKALEIDPNHIGSLNNLADEFEQSGETDKAHELFHYLVNLQPDNPLSHFNLGNYLLRQNHHIEAAKSYETAIEKDDDFIDAYYNIAWILYNAKAYKHSLEYVTKGLEKDSSNEDLIELNQKLENT